MPIALVNRLKLTIPRESPAGFRACLGICLAMLVMACLSTAKAEPEGKSDTPPRVNIALFEYPPLFHTAESARISGLVAETLKELCRFSQLSCRFHMRPVSRAYQEIETGQVQALVTVRFERFRSCCIASQWQYPWRSGLYSKRSVDQIPDSLDAIRGSQLIVVQGWQSPYSYFDGLSAAERQGELTLYRANSSQSSLLMLQRDRAPYLWGGEEFQWYIERMGIPGVQFRPLLELPFVLWISRNEAQIISRFNEGFQIMKRKGLLDSDNRLIEPLLKSRYEDP